MSQRKSKDSSHAEGNYYDPHLHRRSQHQLNNMETFINLVKCSIGSGCLAMPMAFSKIGWINGIFSTFLIGSTVIYALHVLVNSIYEICKREHVPNLSYPDAVRVGFKDGPPMLSALSDVAGLLVDFYMVLFPFGTCCVFVVFIAENFRQIGSYFNLYLDTRLYMCVLILPLIPIFSIRDLKSLAPFAAAASIMCTLGLIGMMYYVLTDLPPLGQRYRFLITDYSIFFGIVLFSLESVGVILAVESKMKSPKDFLGVFGVFNISSLFVLTLYSLIGFFGYWRYGEDIKASITLNIPRNEIFSQFIKLIFALSMYFAYAIQGYVSVEIIWDHLFYADISEHDEERVAKTLRISMVLASVICSVVFPDLVLCMSLVGTFCMSVLGFIVPALLDICVRYRYRSYGPFSIYLLKDFLMFSTGLIGGIIGTYGALQQMIDKYDVYKL